MSKGKWSRAPAFAMKGQDLMTEMTTFRLDNLPIPPSENAMYCNRSVAGRKGRMSSAELLQFRAAMSSWAWKYRDPLKKAKSGVQGAQAIWIHADFHMLGSRLFTKAGAAKIWDVSNRIKALHDVVAQLLGVDDRIFFRVSCEKIGDVVQGLPEYVTVEITPMRLRDFQGCVSLLGD